VSKSGLHALTRHVANAYGKQNIRSNALALGMILSDNGRHNMTPAMLGLLTQHNALARLGQPDDIAETVAFLFLISPAFSPVLSSRSTGVLRPTRRRSSNRTNHAWTRRTIGVGVMLLGASSEESVEDGNHLLDISEYHATDVS
jgi:hypothetical protein